MNNDLQQQINNLDKRIKALEGIVGSTSQGEAAGQQKKKLSLKEFLLTKKPSDDVKRTLGIGYFLENFESFTSFNTDDLLDAYEKAKEKKPLNINDKVNMNIRNGHMAESAVKKDNKKAWYITNSGESFVEKDFKTSK